jgi:RNA recognition motif-containing protein
MNVVQEIIKINERELELGITADSAASWHSTYADSAYVFIGNIDHNLSEGDVLAVFSQFGEVVDLNLCRVRTAVSSLSSLVVSHTQCSSRCSFFTRRRSSRSHVPPLSLSACFRTRTRASRSASRSSRTKTSGQRFSPSTT